THARVWARCCLSVVTLSGAALYFFIFFFQAEDGIRDRNVTGVQTCALPISFYGYHCEIPDCARTWDGLECVFCLYRYAWLWHPMGNGTIWCARFGRYFYHFNIDKTA